MAINPTECWNFVEAPVQKVVTEYPVTIEYNGTSYYAHELNAINHQNTIFIMAGPVDYDWSSDVALLIKYNPDYISGTSIDVVFPVDLDVYGGAVFYEDEAGEIISLRSNYKNFPMDNIYSFQADRDIRCTLFKDTDKDEYFWQLSEFKP